MQLKELKCSNFDCGVCPLDAIREITQKAKNQTIAQAFEENVSAKIAEFNNIRARIDAEVDPSFRKMYEMLVRQELDVEYRYDEIEITCRYEGKQTGTIWLDLMPEKHVKIFYKLNLCEFQEFTRINFKYALDYKKIVPTLEKVTECVDEFSETLSLLAPELERSGYSWSIKDLGKED